MYLKLIKDHRCVIEVTPAEYKPALPPVDFPKFIEGVDWEKATQQEFDSRDQLRSKMAREEATAPTPELTQSQKNDLKFGYTGYTGYTGRFA